MEIDSMSGEMSSLDGIVSGHRLVLPQFLSLEECKELEFIHKSCGVVGYRPWVLSTTLCHLVATNCTNLILPLLPIRERVKEVVEEHFGREYELFTEFTGLISWTKGAKIGWHSDDNRPYLNQRHFSAVCYLNNYGNDFEGGLFHFAEGDPQTIVPTAGTTVIYTADERNMHSVDESEKVKPAPDQLLSFGPAAGQQITDGERCTLTLWFTLDKAHDEDEKLIRQLTAALSLDFRGGTSNQNIEQGRVPIPASSVMYNLNSSLQGEESPEQCREGPSVSDLRAARMARIGFTFIYISEVTGEEQYQPVEVLFRDKKVPGSFASTMHALQVIQFHQYRLSSMKQDSSTGGNESSKGSEISIGARVCRNSSNSTAEDIFGGAQADGDLENHSDGRLKIGLPCNSLVSIGREYSQKMKTDISEVYDFIDSWEEWNAYSSKLWDEVYRFVPMWKASRLLVNHS